MRNEWGRNREEHEETKFQSIFILNYLFFCSPPTQLNIHNTYLKFST